MTIGEKAAYVRWQPNDERHSCHWPGCQRTVPAAMWGCAPHWFKLPGRLRSALWKAYVPGQEVTKTPTPAYIAAAEAIQAWIKENDR